MPWIVAGRNDLFDWLTVVRRALRSCNFLSLVHRFGLRFGNSHGQWLIIGPDARQAASLSQQFGFISHGAIRPLISRRASLLFGQGGDGPYSDVVPYVIEFTSSDKVKEEDFIFSIAPNPSNNGQ